MGDYMADLIVDNLVVVEIKGVRSLNDAHVAQCLNYLKATGIRVGLLINFGSPKVQVKRVVNDF